MPSDSARAKTFNIRFSDEEWARLDIVSGHYGITAAGVIRMLVKREADVLRGIVPAKPASKKPSRGLERDIVKVLSQADGAMKPLDVYESLRVEPFSYAEHEVTMTDVSLSLEAMRTSGRVFRDRGAYQIETAPRGARKG